VTRDDKVRQAAFVYLHVVILYEAAAYAMWRGGRLPTHFGPPWVWLLVGGAVGLGVFFALLRGRSPWIPRAVWLVHGLRLPALVGGAFFVAGNAHIAPPSFYLTAMVVVMVNLWMLARAGWDL